MDLDALGMETNFSTLDWGIVAVYLIATVAIGLYANRYIANMTDYIVAGRSLRSYLGIATMIGTELGLVTVMYAAQKGFTAGFAAFHIGLLAGIVTLAVGLTGFIVVPLRRMGVMTIPQFYERRFGPGVRQWGGLLLAFSGILNMGMFLKTGAIFVGGLTGLHNPTHVNLIMTVMLVLVLTYTILGGMVSVVITDYLQFVVLSVGLMLACGFAVAELNWDTIIASVHEVHKNAGFNPFDGDGFGGSYVLWMAYIGLIGCAVWQTAVIRACAAVDESTVRRIYCWSSIGFLVRMMVPQFLGICAIVFLWNHDTARTIFFTTGGQTVNDPALTMQALPIFLSQILPVGVIGLIAAGMLAAFMSSHDSYLLCWASVLAEDVCNPFFNKGLSTKSRLRLARLFILLIGGFILIWGLWYPMGQDLWDYMAITGAIYFTGATALLVLGLYWKGASRVGAYLGLASGAMALLGLKPIGQALQLDFDGAVLGLIILAWAVGLMIVGSLIFPDRRHLMEGAA